MSELKSTYKRVVLKLSGEALAHKDENGSNDRIYDDALINDLAAVIKSSLDLGVQIGIVIGGGNIWRGEYGKNVERTRADHMGMLATMINCLRMQDALLNQGIDTIVMSSVQMNGVAEVFDHKKAMEHLEKGGIVIFGGGIGIPFVSTDTATVVRAAEISADTILMAKNVSGVFTADPKKVPDAKKYKKLSYSKALADGLKATDAAASAIAMSQKINMYVFPLNELENIVKAVSGEEIGTLVTFDSDAEAILY